MAISRPTLDSGRVSATILIGEDGEYAGPRAFPLATNGALTNANKVRGGLYIWASEASNWNSATATIQQLGQDGTTWRPLRNAANSADLTMTANGALEIRIGTGATFRVVVTGGTPANFYSNLASA